MNLRSKSLVPLRIACVRLLDLISMDHKNMATSVQIFDPISANLALLQR